MPIRQHYVIQQNKSKLAGIWNRTKKDSTNLVLICPHIRCKFPQRRIIRIRQQVLLLGLGRSVERVPINAIRYCSSAHLPSISKLTPFISWKELTIMHQSPPPSRIHSITPTPRHRIPNTLPTHQERRTSTPLRRERLNCILQLSQILRQSLLI